MMRARRFVAIGTAIQIAIAIYVSFRDHLWSRSDVYVTVAVVIVGVPLFLGLFAIRSRTA